MSSCLDFTNDYRKKFFSCTRTTGSKIVKPSNMKKEKSCSTVLSMLKKKVSCTKPTQSSSLLRPNNSLLSDDSLLNKDPLSLSPIKHSSSSSNFYFTNDLFFMGENIVERGMKELDQMTRELDETRKINRTNEELDSKIRELDEQKKLRFETNESNRELLEKHLGSEYVKLIDYGKENVTYSDFYTGLVVSHLSEEIQRYCLVDMSYWRGNLQESKEWKDLEKENIGNLEVLQNIL